MPSFDELAATYLSACRVEGKSPRTIATYAQSIRVWQKTAAELHFPEDADDLSVTQVYQFLAAVQAGGATRGYQRRLHLELRTFLSWCVRMGLLTTNILDKLVPIKRDEVLIQPFLPAEVIALLNAGACAQRTAKRNVALILFLLDTGVRASECIQVRLDDVDWGNGRIRILHAKGRKQRWVGFGEHAAAALRDYLVAARGWEPGALFLSTYRRTPLRVFALNALLTRLGALAGVPNVHPHRFRHTFATWALRSMAREIDVQHLLGHSSMGMTQRYARTYSSEQAVLGHRTFSPVGLLLAPEAPEPLAGRPSTASDEGNSLDDRTSVL